MLHCKGARMCCQHWQGQPLLWQLQSLPAILAGPQRDTPLRPHPNRARHASAHLLSCPSAAMQMGDGQHGGEADMPTGLTHDSKAQQLRMVGQHAQKWCTLPYEYMQKPQIHSYGTPVSSRPYPVPTSDIENTLMYLVSAADPIFALTGSSIGAFKRGSAMDCGQSLKYDMHEHIYTSMTNLESCTCQIKRQWIPVTVRTIIIRKCITSRKKTQLHAHSE